MDVSLNFKGHIKKLYKMQTGIGMYADDVMNSLLLNKIIPARKHVKRMMRNKAGDLKVYG